MASIYDECRPDFSEDEIRVLILHPGQPTDAITFSLAIRKLEPTASYTAISYAWETSDDPIAEPPARTVFYVPSNGSDNVQCTIGHNIYTCLLAIRSEDEPLALWIDAICIDQHERSDEKSILVPVMDRIYQCAQETIIWLGEETDDSQLAMRTVRDFKVEDLAATDLDPADAHWTAVRRLLRRRYWSRLWCLQECMLSQRPVVRCGRDVVPLGRFVEMRVVEDEYKIQHVRQCGGLQLFNSGVPLSECFLSWDEDKKRLEEGGHGILLGDWYSWTMRLGCRDPLDRVYALLGLIFPGERKFIKVDYSQDPGAVYMQAVTTSFQFRGLNIMHHGFVHERKMDIPSWAPDWSSCEDHVPLFGWPRIDNDGSVPGNRSVYNPSPLMAHQFWQSEAIPPWSKPFGNEGIETCCAIFYDERLLCTKGLVIDRIVYHSPNPMVEMYGGLDLSWYDGVREKREEETVRSSQSWESFILSLASTTYDSQPGGRYEAFWRTLICDRSFDWQSPVPSSYADLFEIWMRRQHADLPAKERRAKMFAFYAPVVSRCMTRAFAVTKHGRFGLVPGRAKVNDLIVVLKGGTTPFVLRSQGDKHQFIGDSYVHGVMNAELLDTANPADVQEFWLQ